VPIVPELRLPATLAVRFIFPHAPVRPVSLNQGYPMRAWYDISALGGALTENAAGLVESAALVEGYIEAERALGIGSARILLAGFSQGGALALHTGLRHRESLAGILALSTYLPLRDQVAREASAANRATPILMCHGRQDGVLPMQLGAASRDLLLQLGYPVTWREYAMEHQVCEPELREVSAWLAQRLGPAALVSASGS
jgi:phospholipase/carboxylesterase